MTIFERLTGQRHNNQLSNSLMPSLVDLKILQQDLDDFSYQQLLVIMDAVRSSLAQRTGCSLAMSGTSTATSPDTSESPSTLPSSSPPKLTPTSASSVTVTYSRTVTPWELREEMASLGHWVQSCAEHLKSAD